MGEGGAPNSSCSFSVCRCVVFSNSVSVCSWTLLPRVREGLRKGPRVSSLSLEPPLLKSSIENSRLPSGSRVRMSLQTTIHSARHFSQIFASSPLKSLSTWVLSRLQNEQVALSTVDADNRTITFNANICFSALKQSADLRTVLLTE